VQIEHTARFSDALERLGAGEGRILLAVSGGPDSLAMLLLAHEAMPDRIAAATVDHGLRPEAADEAVFVARVCAGLGVAHSILTPDAPITGNVQSAARAARYALLEAAADAADCAFIATAHHADDQLETVLMRVARGSGVGGLSGVRARNGRIVRPLLGFSKAELEEICAEAGVEPVRDPGNNDPDFDRVAMRQFLASGAHPFDAARAALSAEALAEAGEALDWVTNRLLTERMERHDAALVLDCSNLPRELQRRLLLAVLRQFDAKINPRGDAVERLLDELHIGKTATISNILCKGGVVWQFSPAPPRRTP
jgi:tRNA(Ile)-lysidine synthase